MVRLSLSTETTPVMSYCATADPYPSVLHVHQPLYCAAAHCCAFALFDKNGVQASLCIMKMALISPQGALEWRYNKQQRGICRKRHDRHQGAQGYPATLGAGAI